MVVCHRQWRACVLWSSVTLGDYFALRAAYLAFARVIRLGTMANRWRQAIAQAETCSGDQGGGLIWPRTMALLLSSTGHPTANCLAAIRSGSKPLTAKKNGAFWCRHQTNHSPQIGPRFSPFDVSPLQFTLTAATNLRQSKICVTAGAEAEEASEQADTSGRASRKHEIKFCTSADGLFSLTPRGFIQRLL